MIFTKTDKALLDRVARLVRDEARVLEAQHGPAWAATKAGQEAKREYDRLQRDERDLRALARRFEITATAKEEAPGPGAEQ